MLDSSKQGIWEANEWVPRDTFRREDEKAFYHLLPPLPKCPPMTPMYASVFHPSWGATYAARYLSFPFVRSYEVVLYLGRIYVGPMPIFDKDEIEKRQSEFGKVLGDLIPNWQERYQAACDEWRKGLEYLASIDKEKLSLEELLNVLKDALRISKRNYELHFVFMLPALGTYMEFKGLCQKYGIDEADIPKLLQGYPTKATERVRELLRLADLTKEYGIADLFTTAERVEEIPDRIRETDKGRLWLQGFHKFLDVYGRFSADMVHVGDSYCLTWLENPIPALENIKAYIITEFDYADTLRELISGREKFTEECAARIEQPEERQSFLGRLRVQQTIQPFNEDHAFYVEQGTGAEVRYVLLECGKRLVKYGFIENAGDVFFLTIEELKEVLEHLIYDEETTVNLFGRRLSSLVRERKERWHRLHEVEAPLVIGAIPEEQIRDPLLTEVWGLTDEIIRGRGETKAVAETIEGVPGAPGVAEGTAAVVLERDKVFEIPEGAILVTSYTTAHWTPVFSRIKAVVTDIGALLSHTAICAREYGIPAVVGTLGMGAKATEVIKTGQRIKVDGYTGTVTLFKGEP